MHTYCWVRQFETAKARELFISFESCYPRDSQRPCNSVASFDKGSDVGYESPDEVPLALRRQNVENSFGEFD
jgi:hypothetical protein